MLTVSRSVFLCALMSACALAENPRCFGAGAPTEACHPGTVTLSASTWEDDLELDQAVVAALDRAGTNATELIKAIRESPPSQNEAVCFLIANMPDVDLRTLKASYIRENVDWAFHAREKLPWGRAIPEELFLNYVLPYASVNERRDDWRRDFFGRFLPLVKDCRTPAEAAQKLNREMFRMVGVQYHATKRPKPDQSPYESIAAGYASCTGLSILLVDACRAVCVPARLTGTPCWTTKQGNHNWVEIWDKQWYFAGAAEPDPGGLNRAWFVGDAAKADPTDPMHRIYAASFKRTPISFPLAWDLSLRCVSARDVTRYYACRKKVRIQVVDKVGGRPVAARVTLYLDGESYALGETPDPSSEAQADLEFELPGGESFDIVIEPAGDKARRTTLTTTNDDHQRVTLTVAGQ